MHPGIEYNDFLGVGWAFPLAVDPDGEIAVVAHEQDIRQSIWIILGTSPGERVMRPDFGAGLRDFVFAPINTATMTEIKHRVEVSLITWEPRIDVQNISVASDSAVRNRLLISIDYRVRSTNTFYNLVYPFYLLEGERS